MPRLFTPRGPISGPIKPYQRSKLSQAVASAFAATPRTAYWVGGTGNWTDAANHWAGRSGGVPAAAYLPDTTTNVVFDAQSATGAYTVTVDASASCQNLTFLEPPPSGTITFAGGSGLNVTGNLTALSGMVMSYTGTITVTGANNITIKSNGITWGRIDLNFIGTCTLLDALTMNNALQFSILAGTFIANGFNITTGAFSATGSGTRVIDMTGITWTVTINNGTVDLSGTNITFTPPATMSFTGASGTVTLNGGARTYNTVQFTTPTGTVTINQANTFGAFLFTGGAGKNAALTLTANQTVTGALTLTGNSAINRPIIQSSVVGTARTITAGSIASMTNVDFMDITGAGTAAPFTGTSIGDCLGNSGITMTASVAQAATGTASFTWSTHGWTTRVPLPQDDVTIANAFVAAQTITMDMPRMGRSITFAGVSGNPVLSQNVAGILFGSLTMGATMTRSLFGNTTFMGRTNVTLTSAGVLFTGGILTDGPGTNLTFQDAFTCNFGGLSVTRGGFNLNGFNHSVPQITISATAAGTIALGAGTCSLTGTGSVWNINSSGGLTFTPSTSTLKITDTSGAIKTFTGFGATYNNLWFSGAGGGPLVISGANTFSDVKASPGCVIEFPAATTQTMSTCTAFGTAPGGGDAQYAQFFSVAGGYHYTPDALANRISGDIDIRVQMKAAYSTWSTTIIVAKDDANVKRAFSFQTLAGAKLRFLYTNDGTTVTGRFADSTATVSSVFADLALAWVRVTYATATGVVTFYTSPDGSTWTQLGTTVTITAGTLFNSNSNVTIGAIDVAGTFPFIGMVYRAQILSGIGGTLAVDYNPATYAAGSTWVSATGETWNMNGNALVTASNRVGFTSTTTAVCTVAKSGGGKVKGDYLALRLCNASTTFTWYAGSNSFDEAGNTNWLFYSPDYTLTGAAGSFAIAGNAANELYGRRLTAAAAAFTIAGQAASLIAGRKITASAGAFVINGQAAALLKGYRIIAAAGAYSMTGKAANLTIGRRLTASAGSFTITGQASAPKYGRVMQALAGSFTISGQAAALIWREGRPALGDELLVPVDDLEFMAVDPEDQLAFAVDDDAAPLVLDPYDPNDAASIDGA